MRIFGPWEVKELEYTTHKELVIVLVTKYSDTSANEDNSFRNHIR